MLLRLSLTVAVSLLFFALGNAQLPYEKDAHITPKEKVAIERFRKNVVPKIPASSYINNYLNDDLFFVRWLRAKNMDVSAATKMFNEHLKWRQVNNADTMHEEDWSEMKLNIPIYTDTFDREGRPVGELYMDEWKARTMAVAGKSKQVIRWISYLFESHSRQVFALRAEGKNVSQALILVGLENFNLVETGCPRCLPMYAALTGILDNQYPNIWETLNFISIPPAFDIVLRVISPIMRPTTRRAMKSYPDPARWKKILDQKIDKSQRSERYDGTIVRDQHI